MKRTLLAGVLLLTLFGGAQAQIQPGGGGSGGSPTGNAGGDLGGTYPNPTVTNGSHITNASIPNSGLATPAPCSAFGTTAGTCAQGNDSRITGAAPLASPTFTGTPAAPTPAASDNSTTLATTAYVTTAIANAIAGVNPAVAVQAASAAKLPNSPVFLHVDAGIGSTITAGTNSVLVVDGYTPILGDRILVKNEGDSGGLGASRNGVYKVTQLGVGGVLPWILTRALDFDQPSDINSTGAIPVINGTANVQTQWVVSSAVATVDTDPITFAQFSLNPTTLVTKLGQSTLPFVLLPSGSFGNNGAWTTTNPALATAYPNAYCSVPAGAIATGVPAAQQWYYCTFSGTQAATLFNNTYASCPTATLCIPASPTAFVTTGPGAYTQTTGSNIAAYTLSIPGNTIGLNGGIRVNGSRTYNSSAGAKTLSIAYDSYTFASGAVTTGNNVQGIGAGFVNRGVTNVQMYFYNGQIGIGGGAQLSPLTGAIDSTATKNLTFNMQLATATDNMVLESATVELLPGVP